MPILSIVSTVYKSRPFLPSFLSACLAVVAELGLAADEWELVLADDGSPDDSLAWLRQQQAAYPQVVLVELARNFGHHYAAVAGLACQGAAAPAQVAG